VHERRTLDNAEKVNVVVLGVDTSEPAEAAIEQALELLSAHERSEVVEAFSIQAVA